MPAGPTLLYDADCSFCQRSLDVGRRWLGWFPPATGFQDVDLAAFGVTREQAEHSIQLYWPGRRIRHGAAAVASILLAQRAFGWRLLGGLLATPPLSWAASGIYALIARFRHRLPGGSPRCQVPPR